MMAAGLAAGWPLRNWLKPSLLSKIAFFCFCLTPILVGSDGVTQSVNYSFILYLLPLLLATGGLERPSDVTLAAITLYVGIFALAAVYQTDFAGHFFNRVTSFVVFMSVFTFLFAKLNDELILAFKAAVMIMGCYFSIQAIVLFFVLGGSALSYDAKDLVGSQRYGFIYVLAFWLLYLANPRQFHIRILKYALTFVVLIGLALTFSRSSIVALVVSYALFVGHSFFQVKNLSLGRVAKAICLLLGGLAIAIYVFATFFPILFDFFNYRLIQFFLSDRVSRNMANPISSEGTRFYIWGKIFSYVLQNPLTGSGFLGSWVLEDRFGSAHNQYMDVLFRTGFFGFIGYLVILYQVSLHLYRSHRSLFWGIMGVFTYGMFHETFKESQGAVVLAVLVAMALQQRSAIAIPTGFVRLIPVRRQATGS